MLRRNREEEVERLDSRSLAVLPVDVSWRPSSDDPILVTLEISLLVKPLFVQLHHLSYSTPSAPSQDFLKILIRLLVILEPQPPIIMPLFIFLLADDIYVRAYIPLIPLTGVIASYILILSEVLNDQQVGLLARQLGPHASETEFLYFHLCEGDLVYLQYLLWPHIALQHQPATFPAFTLRSQDRMN